MRSWVRDAAAAWELDPTGATVMRDSLNETVLVPVEGAILRAHRAEAGLTRVHGLHRARETLAEAGILTVPLLRTVDGATCVVVDARVVEAETYVAHDDRMNSPVLLLQGAAVLARIHNAWGKWLPAMTNDRRAAR